MITESEIYWITRLDDIRITLCVLAVLAVACIFVTGIISLAHTMDNEKIPKSVLSVLHLSLLVVVAALSVRAFVPKTKDAAMIKVIPMIANSKFVAEELPADARQIYDLGKKALVEKLKGEKIR